MNVDIEELDKIIDFLRSIEKCDLKCIRWFYKGNEIIPDKYLIDECQFIGLNNRTFAEMHLLDFMPLTKKAGRR